MANKRKFISVLLISFSYIVSNSFEEVVRELNDQVKKIKQKITHR